MSYEVGSIMEGIVSRITKFGAFVELPGGKDGLIHISEVADEYVKNIEDFIKEKDKVKVKIISIDKDGKIGLSVRQVNPKVVPARKNATRPPYWSNEREQEKRGMSFEERLSKFMKESEERLSELKKSTESKRGGRGGRRS